jgi:hypothetical protein
MLQIILRAQRNGGSEETGCSAFFQRDISEHFKNENAAATQARSAAARPAGVGETVFRR